MSNATTARDILSNNDIAATCGDADCATSDAEMTAPVALTLAEVNALPVGARVVRLDAGGALYSKFAGAQCYAVDAAGNLSGRKIMWRAGRFALARWSGRRQPSWFRQ